MAEAARPFNPAPDDLAQTLLRILEGDDPVRSEANAHCLIAAAVAYLSKHYGAGGVVDLLLDKAETVHRMTLPQHCERPAGIVLH